MPSYEFQSMLYRTKADMLGAIAYEWWTGGGASKPAMIDELMATSPMSAEAAAAECIEGFGLDAPDVNRVNMLNPETYDDEGNPTETSHMALYGYTAKELAGAMQDFMDTRPDREPEDEEDDDEHQ